jgi:two-component system response regulator MprA
MGMRVDLQGAGAPAADVVLVATPDAARSASIAQALAAERLLPVTAFSGATVSRFTAVQTFVAVVVDAALDHGGDRPTLLATLRATTTAPIVVIGGTPCDGRAEPVDGISRLPGGDASAADVVGTVVTAIACRAPGDDVVASADLVVDLHNVEAWRGTQRLDLTPTEVRLLAALVAAHGDLVTKPALQTAAWGSASTHDDIRLQAHMRRLRTKLDDASADGACRMRTVRGLGFRLEHAPAPAAPRANGSAPQPATMD